MFTTNDGNHINKPLSVIGKSEFLRSQIKDAGTGQYRDFASTAEVISHFTIPGNPDLTLEARMGHFPIYVHSGGVTTEWWWKDNYTDAGLVERPTTASGGGGGGASWGSITGTISSQTDLQSSLTAATNSALTTVRAGVATAGDTLAKLYSLIQTLNTLVTGTANDGDSIVNTVQEILTVFNTYPEGVNIITTLAGKVNTADIVNTLTETAAGKVLDARQGKALKDLIDALTTTVSGKQATLVSGVNIKTYDGQSIIGPGNITPSGGGSSISIDNAGGTGETILRSVDASTKIIRRLGIEVVNGSVAPVVTDDKIMYTLTLPSVGGGGTMAVQSVSAGSQVGVTNTKYYLDNVGLTTISLPTTAARGDDFIIVGVGGTFRITQAGDNSTGQIIYFNGGPTTKGSAGYLEMLDVSSSITLTCTKGSGDGSTEWQVLSNHGTVNAL